MPRCRCGWVAEFCPRCGQQTSSGAGLLEEVASFPLSLGAHRGKMVGEVVQGSEAAWAKKGTKGPAQQRLCRAFARASLAQQELLEVAQETSVSVSYTHLTLPTILRV